MINYSNAYIELKLTISINYDNEETAKDSIPNEYYVKSSYEIVKSLRIMLNNAIISNENDINRSNLVNYILNNGKSNPISHRNINKATASLSAKNNKFITKTNYSSDDSKTHDIKFKIPIYLKDISNFFKNIGIINFGEFNINLTLIDNIISVKSGREFSHKINNAYLIVEEIQLTNEDNINHLKMLNSGYTKKINFMENHVKTFNIKMNGVDENFQINNVSKSDSVFIYGIDKNRKTGLQHDLPGVEFSNASINIDNIRFENPIINDISAFEILKNKSNYSDDFFISYCEFKNNYRIYCFNTNRETHEDNSNRYMNIITNINIKDIGTPTVYVIWRNYATITMNYDKDGLVVYKSY